MQDRTEASRTQEAPSALSTPADRTPAFYRRRAVDVRTVGALAEATAKTAETAFTDLGSVGEDFGTRLALRLRECAREASWTATQLDVYAAEAQEDVGRLGDEVRASAPVIVLADVAQRTQDGAA